MKIAYFFAVVCVDSPPYPDMIWLPFPTLNEGKTGWDHASSLGLRSI